MRGDRFLVSFFAAVTWFAIAATAQAADAAGDDALARGQQAYASGDPARAEQFLSEAIQRDPHDPRPYYLRALCLARAGHTADARASLVIAAALESRNPNRYPVAATIAQLVGRDRTLVNQFRWHSQTADVALALDRGEMAFDQRPTPAVRTDAGVLRQRVSLPLGQLAHTTTLSDLAEASAKQAPTAAIETGSNPFADDPALQAPAGGQTAIEELPFSSSVAADAPSNSTHDSEVEDPFAPEAKAPTAEGKIPSGKLLGILSRAVARAAPLPSLDAVRDQLPSVPLPGAANQPAAAEPTEPDPFGADVQPAAFSDDDPFGMPPEDHQQDPPTSDEQPAADPEEDPFG